ncbi:hemerythrin domain-containing protein [Noviherbaspirillum sp.]|uniref:hemerythrin domain-containing protein n=1 Tax=Noviherbaspirillum sp. TaxID=1926288 RepID=UPI002B493AA7|nr:hemerythrin domain-containing protein [Noviherbaspirillum sp.]HJV82105.1 hemerythrin domain-containing protein [Noviherbaspirillum sp.]
MRLPPTQAAIRVLQEEHDLLSAMIRGMEYFVRTVAEGGKAPESKVFRAMLLYITEYPDRVHHPKEDHYLFARLRERSNAVDDVLDTLESEHKLGDRLVLQLQNALTRFELHGALAFGDFSNQVQRYSQFYHGHMRLEEDIVLPAAVQYLNSFDWEEINAAFLANDNPLAGTDYKKDMQKLFSLIANIAPPPVGLGPET